MKSVAFLDANVLYSSMTRSVLIYLALAEVCQVRWSNAVHEEWIRNLTANRPDLDAKRLARTRALMDARIPDALVTGYEPLMPSLVLPDLKDRHVLAAAVHGGVNVIVTENLKDFPAAALVPYSMVAMHPDAFILGLIEAEPAKAVRAFAVDRSVLRMPAMSTDEYLDALVANKLPLTAAALRPFSAAF